MVTAAIAITTSSVWTWAPKMWKTVPFVYGAGIVTAFGRFLAGEVLKEVRRADHADEEGEDEAFARRSGRSATHSSG